ncbi:MAG: MBL fold metallo-hydrolase, partial [Ketobacteraceae bacterium]|nr:MBL fold metallo-hydrolase [Ketobacteraceae bacterium]
ASPIPIKATRRLVPAAVAENRLPPLDVIVISHNHYDHLDTVALKRLARAHPQASVVVPLGLKDLLGKAGFSDITELDWYDTTHTRDLRIQALPAIHTSKRGVGDTNRTLWCGFGINDGSRSAYFAGDTAYGQVFQEIGQRCGGFDLGLVPIGAYQPRVLMKPVHCTPEEAISIGRDIGARHLVGMHWGTIRLTTEPMLEPRDRFLGAEDTLSRQVMRIGETISW